MYDRVSEFLRSEFKNSLIRSEYIIKAKPGTSGNPTYNAILEIIYKVLENYIWIYNLY